ncbi:MAG TPA: hypothetical protein VGI74_21395 [Streptosporangiaceae bacterium]
MPAQRMNREEFFTKLAPLDDAGLRKALWNLYWRGSAQVRERIESEIEPAEKARRKQAANEPRDPWLVQMEVQEFVRLARSGAYMGGDRQVSPRERSRWRVTFRQLATDAQASLRATDPGPAETALAELIDLACETRSWDYFHSEDPMEAAKFVVSDAVELLWGTLRDRYGFAGFADRAAPQLIRWESRFGWTRSGWGQLSEKETPLADVLTRMLTIPDMWSGFAERYLSALDEAGRSDTAASDQSWSGSDPKRKRKQRADNLAGWNLVLLDRLDGPETGHLLDKLAAHPALDGPERTLLQAHLAQRRGDRARAHTLVRKVLKELPGHREAIAFAAETKAPLPPGTAKLLEEQSGYDPSLPEPWTSTATGP